MTRVQEATGRPWVDGMTIGHVLRLVARRDPDREALVFPRHGYRATYAEYDAQVDAAARGLLALGIQPGDHVAVWSTNRPEWVLLQIATARIGAVLVTVNPAFHEEELLYVLGQSRAKALFLTDRFKKSDYFATTLAALPELQHGAADAIACEAAPALRSLVSFSDEHPACMVSWHEMIVRGERITREALADIETGLEADDPINLQYTSGTTGFPKGALLSHRNVLLNAWYVGASQRMTAADRVCCPVPLYHCFGCVIGSLGCLVRGATLLTPSEFFDAEATLDCLEGERATSVYGVPTMFIAALEHPSFVDRDLSSLRTGIMAGAPCPVELMHKVIDEMGVAEITIAYGMTEASPGATTTSTDDPIELRVETVGVPMPGVEVRAVDPETGEPCADGEQGEICIRGHNVMLGYYDMPEATASAIDTHGWLHSGDLGVRDPNGYFRITGRIKDMLIRGGENIYPREIEEVLYQHPAVEQAEVIGVPDERFGEEVGVWIKLHRGSTVTAEELREFCARQLAYYKIPRYVVFAEEFPTTVSGKVQKFRLRAMTVEKLARGEVDDARNPTRAAVR